MPSMRPIGRQQLLDPDFLESVRRLRLAARRVTRGGRFAEQRSRDLGHGLEFRDFRPYTPGDDVRSIDWNIYRRLGKVFLRLFEEFEDLPLYLLPDVSASQYLEDPPRALAGLRTALALGAISLGQHDKVAIFPFADDLRVTGRPLAGANRILALAGALADLPPGGRTDIARSLRRLGGMKLRRGLVAVVSDFFDPAGLPAVTEALRRVRHSLLLVQLVRSGDRAPQVTGDVCLVDCESGERQNVSITDAVLQRYGAAYQRFEQGLQDFARQRGATLLALDADGDIAAQLAQVLHSRQFVA